MKRILLIIAAMMLFLSAWCQTDEITRQQADKLDSVTVKLMNQKRYEDAIKTKERELAILKALYGEKDTTYIKQFAFSAKLYYRNEQPDMAAKIIEQAAQLYADNVSNSDAMYAFYLDNLSLYQSSNNEYDKAKENSRKALTIYEKLGQQDFDLAIILMHMAETSHYCGESQEALKYEIRSLNIIKKLCGEHSDEYIGELPFLQKYYQADGDEKNAQRVGEKIEKLQKEKDDGFVDLPELIEFKSAELCHEHNDDALKCIQYYLTHTIRAPQMDQAAQYIMAWSIASGDVNIVIGEEVGSLASSKESMPYLVGFMAAYSYVCLRDNVKDLNEAQLMDVFDILLQFYEPNSSLTGKVELLDKYLKLKEKGKLEKEIHKIFTEQQAHQNTDNK